MKLTTSVTKFPAVRERVVEGLERLGIRTVRDVLFHFPSRYEDRSKIIPIRDASVGEQATFCGTIIAIGATSGFRRRRGGRAKYMPITEARVADETGEIQVTWFHQPYLVRQYKQGTNVYLVGSPTIGKNGVTLVAPEIERVFEDKIPVHAGRIVPIYPETEGVTSRMIRFLIHRSLPASHDLREYMPESVRTREGLAGIANAVLAIHFPENESQLRSARERLAFDELFLFQLAMLVVRRRRTEEHAPVIRCKKPVIADATAALPFSLTQSQEHAVSDILRDMEKGHPMNRLLAGDVGSGKTVVAGLAGFAAASSGFQTAFVAPTEILANQHASTIMELFGKTITMRCLTGATSEAERRDMVSEVGRGDTNIIIGTHALFGDDIQFHQLGLVIVDEQHRFGVLQRGVLGSRASGGLVPHFLSLTATPIPRTLQLTAYGDIDVSLLESRPGQQKVETIVVDSNERNTMYASLANRIRSGEQVFVICPRVEERDDDVASVEREFRRLKTDVFPDVHIAMLHGKMSSEEKQHALEQFKKKETDVLVASSVVEVGVDIAGAAAMVIEGAERFGLAQLHQLRGRVGRRGQHAVCYVSATDDTQTAINRLRILERSSNGLEIAEADLARRGMGEICGTRQSGDMRLRVARISDIKFVLRVRHAAEKLIDEDPELAQSPILRQRVHQITATPRFA